MFIWFWEQVWQDETTFCLHNFITAEISRQFWDAWHDDDDNFHATIYPTKYMTLGVDYFDF